MNRRGFLQSLGLGALAIAVPHYGRWYRQGSGILSNPIDYTGFYIEIVDGTGQGQFRRIVGTRPPPDGFFGRSLVTQEKRFFELSQPWSVIPDQTSRYEILIRSSDPTVREPRSTQICGDGVLFSTTQSDLHEVEQLVRVPYGVIAEHWTPLSLGKKCH